MGELFLILFVWFVIWLATRPKKGEKPPKQVFDAEGYDQDGYDRDGHWKYAYDGRPKKKQPDGV